MALIQPDAAGIALCAAKLKAGETVAIPTETVYGLAADATNSAAISQIFAIKRRPRFNPLICHVATRQAAMQLGVFNQSAEKLAAEFWPGPLTLVVPRRAACPIDPLASAGLPSIALRCPAHRLAQTLLSACDTPLVAPSANPSGKLSPSSSSHVAALLPQIDVLDGGACAIGLESTIIGCLDETPLWLRAGGQPRDDIEACLGRRPVDVPDSADAEAKLAPGRLARHYAPEAALRLNAKTASADELMIGFGPDAPPDCAATLSRTGDLAQAAANLFATLHAMDARAVADGKTLAIMTVPDEGLGEAINDRLRRAEQTI